jgi:hypothetical protein
LVRQWTYLSGLQKALWEFPPRRMNVSVSGERVQRKPARSAGYDQSI